jgi:hypothetical protein
VARSSVLAARALISRIWRCIVAGRARLARITSSFVRRLACGGYTTYMHLCRRFMLAYAPDRRCRSTIGKHLANWTKAPKVTKRARPDGLERKGKNAQSRAECRKIGNVTAIGSSPTRTRLISTVCGGEHLMVTILALRRCAGCSN